MDVAGHRLVSDYLSRLHAAAWLLPADRRTDLMNRTRDQLHVDLGDEPSADLARAALDRLGPPEDLVQVDLAEVGPAPVRPPPKQAVWGSREVATVLLLAIGGLAVPVLGPVVGLVMAWFSDRWTTVDRLVAVSLVVLPLLLAALVADAAPTAVTLLVPLAGLVPAGYLALVLQRRAAARAHEVPSEG